MSKRFSGRRDLDQLKHESVQSPGKILSVLRKVDDESSSLIGGSLGNLASSNDIPELKGLPLKHVAYVFDPRLLDKRFNRGFIAATKFAELSRRVDEADLVDKMEIINARIGEVALLSHNRKTLVVDLVSDRLDCERASFYEALAFAGIKGFTSDGKVSGTRKNNPVTISIGTFKQGVAKRDESEILEAIATGLAVNLSQYDGTVELGEREIKTYSPH